MNQKGTYWWERPWLALDIETTGLDTSTCRIIEIGVCLVQGLEITHRESRLVDPGVRPVLDADGEVLLDESNEPVTEPFPIEFSAIEAHGMTEFTTAGEKSISQLSPWLCNLVRSVDVIVGHNFYAYDLKVLDRQLGLPWEKVMLDTSVIDTYPLVHNDDIGGRWPGRGRHKMVSLAERFELKAEGLAHRAQYDSEMTAKALLFLLKDREYGPVAKRILANHKFAEAQLRQDLYRQNKSYWIYREKKRLEEQEEQRLMA